MNRFILIASKVIGGQKDIIEMVAAGTGEHVNIADRATRVIKERSRCIMADLPWKLPIVLTEWLIYCICICINSLSRMLTLEIFFDVENWIEARSITD